MSFMALPPSSPPATAAPAPVPAPATAPPPGIIENDSWFPDIALGEMRDAMRLDGTVTDARLVQAVVDAVLHVNRELAPWQALPALRIHRPRRKKPHDVRHV